jgi:hypothetical protein
MINTIQLLNDCVIRMGQVTLSPWPCFNVEGECDDLPGVVVELLLSNNPVAMLWAAKIPDDLRQLLLSFPESLVPELLTLSQMWPEKFGDWSKWCPALIALLTQIKAEDGKCWDGFDRLRLMQAGWREVLKAADWPATGLSLNILRKLPINHCTPQNLIEVRQHLNDRRKRKLLGHCRSITSLTLDTLKLPASMLSVRLLEMDENDLLPLDVDSVSEMCHELLRYRQELGLEPLWPYRHGRLSARTLFNAVQLKRMVITCEKLGGSTQFPPPPVSAIQSSKINIEPLTKLSALHREGNQMQNCIVSYGTHVLQRTHYVYRLNLPERATVLLARSGDDWIPVQVKTYRNGNPHPETIELIERWLGTTLEKEAQDDFPF